MDIKNRKNIEIEFDDDYSDIDLFFKENIVYDSELNYDSASRCIKNLIDNLNSSTQHEMKKYVVAENLPSLRSIIKNGIKFFGSQGTFNWIDVSKMTTLNSLFKGMEWFNGDVSQWDTHNIVNMNETFCGCTCFNRDISCWDYSNVKYAQNFIKGTALNQSNKMREIIDIRLQAAKK